MDPWLPGVGAGRRDKQAETEGFGGGASTPYDTTTVDACHYTFVQTHSMYKSRATPDVNCGLQVTMTSQCGFIHCSKRSVWWGCGQWGRLCGGGVLQVCVWGALCLPLNVALT